MKTKNIFLAIFSLILMASVIVTASENPVNSTDSPNMPDKVKVAIDKSCFGCHNTASKNEDAKDKLDFKKLDGLSKIKKISAYKQIGETIEEGEMPPKKFLQRYPDKKLTDAEKKLLVDWAKKEAQDLVKN